MKYDTIREWYEGLTGSAGDKLTPDWNIKRCRFLLGSAPNAKERKLIRQELIWWEKQKEAELKHDKLNPKRPLS